MTNTKMTLVDWLDDLCVRFIVNLPNEELQSVERICFQIEEAQWFYEDFIRPLDPNNLPSMHLRKFSQLIFQHCPLFSAYSEALHQQAYEQFLAYKTRVPVRGAIMLNQDMTHAVLVKGWKKGAKWSFPRGKINKEEPDLDCAVREVYEETGYDLHEANLVEPDENMKKITVTMREQSMMLYVFRGVPMDTYFEPRTRKEISKIDWYKLTDLPTLRRKNQVQQQAPGQDLIKESSFYMVAPFLGPLRAWIKQQHKLDKQKVRSSAYLAPPPVAITDDEDAQPEIYETTADEVAPVSNMPPSTDNFADLVAQLSRGRPSDILPELSDQRQVQQQAPDPAAELKRLLSVGMGMQSPPVEAPSVPVQRQQQQQQQQQPNPLLALFHGQSGPQMPQPRTPFDQVIQTPIQPSSPHGQHHPRAPQMGNMGPPPPFPFPHQHQGVPFQGPPQFHGMPPHLSPQYMPPPQNRNPAFSQQLPNMQQAFDERNPRPFQEAGDSHFTNDHGRPAVPHASNLPAPNLNTHAMGLLNSFKTNNQKPAQAQPTIHHGEQSAHDTPRIQQPVPQHRPHGLASPQGSYPPSPPQFQSPAISLNFQPEQPQPRSLHHDSLLTLFRATPPVASPEPAELSAHPTTPGYLPALPVSNHPRLPGSSLLDTFGANTTRKSATTATVSGPVNVPDFETVKKHTQPPTGGSSRGPSPAMPFMPQQILKRGQPSPAPRVPSDATKTSQNGSSNKTAKAPVAPQAAFKPQILKRPQQEQQQERRQSPQTVTLAPVPKQTAHTQGLLDMFKGPSPQPAPAQPVRPVQPSPSPAHAQGLLDMFKGPPTQLSPPQAARPIQQSHSPAHTQGLLDMFKVPSPQPPAQSAHQIQPSRSPAHAQGLLDMFKGTAPQSAPSTQSSRSPAPPAALADMDRRESIPSGQKNTLLALFGNKPSPKPSDARAPPPLQSARSPALPGRSTFPPTPKTAMSGLISPVSPLPANLSQEDSPARLASRSRISSIGDTAVPGIVIPPTSHPVAVSQQAFSAGRLRGQSADRNDGKSPVDKTFLLGFLEDVARRGR